MAGSQSLLTLLLTVFQLTNFCHCIFSVAVPAQPITNATGNVVEPTKTTCPGMENLENVHHPNNTVIKTDMAECYEPCATEPPQFTSHPGLLYGSCGWESTTFCNVHFEVDKSMYIRARIQRLKYWCESTEWKTSIYSVNYFLGYSYLSDRDVSCGVHSLRELYTESKGHRMYITHYNNPHVRISIEPITGYSVIVDRTMRQSGFIIVPFVLVEFEDLTNFYVEVHVPPRHVIMLSFQQSYEYGTCSQKVHVIYRTQDASQPTVLPVCSTKSMLAKALPAPSITITVNSIHEGAAKLSEHKMHFSFLPEAHRPEIHHNGLFNCSANRYSLLKQHLHCNLKPECQDRRDESEHCPFSSHRCGGRVASRDKCFQLVEMDSYMPVDLAVIQCQTVGGRLASLKTRGEQEDFLVLFKDYYIFELGVGFVSGWHQLPFLYSKFRRWLDGTLIYTLDHFVVDAAYHPSRIAQTMMLRSMRFLRRQKLDTFSANLILCEIAFQSQDVEMVNMTEFHVDSEHTIVGQTRQSLLLCVDGRLTQPWLACNSNRYCLASQENILPKYCPFFKEGTWRNDTFHSPKSPEQTVMFLCEDDATTVHYTMLCDFITDCPDQSDERFCQRLPCQGFQCSDGRCVPHSQRCNEFSDCGDSSDELNCPPKGDHQVPDRQRGGQSLRLVSLDGTGYFTQETLPSWETCPEGHYRCARGDSPHCLPVYTRCNRLSDCVYAEDEQDCERFTCPGLYRCGQSKVCVHGDHLCDGWGQCPQRDDELLCDAACPEGCRCQGHSFRCQKPFSARPLPHLRSVDATGTGMTLTDFRSNWYLSRLTLSRCKLGNVSGVDLPNLRFLNLADNDLHAIDITVINELRNLQFFKIANNPLSLLTSRLLKHIHYELKHVDTSRTHFQMFRGKWSIYLPNVERLNVSFSEIDVISSRGFKFAPNLAELDLRQNPVSVFPVDLFSDLKSLNTIFSSNYRLCCESLLPKTSQKIQCVSSDPIFRSCQNLLPSNLHIIFFGLICTCSILGNLICIVDPFSASKTFQSTFTTFSVNLHVANICMGVHIGVSLAADRTFQGNYSQVEQLWTTSVPCRLAAFLSLLSSQVSVCVFLFVTLDRFIHIYFPAVSLAMEKHYPTLSCSVSWLTGTLLSSIPFLPGKSHWGLDHQSGLCRLALYRNTHQEFKWLTVIATVNIVLYSLLIVALTVICSRGPKHLMMVVDPQTRSAYCSARLLGKVVGTDAACWLSFAAAFAASLHSVRAAQRAHEALVVFVLPVNAALNPLLYLWTVSAMRRQQAKGRRLLEMLQARVGARAKKPQQQQAANR